MKFVRCRLEYFEVVLPSNITGDASCVLFGCFLHGLVKPFVSRHKKISFLYHPLALPAGRSPMARIAIDACFVLAVAIDTERHVVQLDGRSYFFHRRNVAVTGFAIDSLGDVGIMVEVNEIRNAIHFHPGNRLFALPCFSHFHDFRFRCCDKLMAPHAGLDRRNVRMGPAPDSAVAVLTSNLKLARVFGVAERDRLTRSGLLPLTRRQQKARQRREDHNPVEYPNRCLHYLTATLSDESSAALHGARTPCCARMASTSSGLTGGALLLHEERTCVKTAAISEFDSLS